MEFLHAIVNALKLLGVLESWSYKFCVLVQLL